MLRHCRTHDPKNSFPCPKCDARFAYRRSVSRHVASVHDGLRLFACCFCDTKFSRPDTKADHERVCRDGKKEVVVVKEEEKVNIDEGNSDL